jgi:hypothetical protein
MQPFMDTNDKACRKYKKYSMTERNASACQPIRRKEEVCLQAQEKIFQRIQMSRRRRRSGVSFS